MSRASLKLPPSGSSSTKLNSGASLPSNEEINKLQQDLVLLTQKIADLTGEPQRAPPTPTAGGPANAPNSPFVSGLRGMADASSGGGSGVDALRFSMMEKVLKKVADLDRILLKQTAPEKDGGVRARRGSRGMDLFSLPTHLHITDRLLDLHQQSKRVVTVTKGGPSPESCAPEGPPPAERRPTISPPNGAMSPRSSVEKRLREEVSALKQKLEESEAKRTTVKDDCSAARKENLMYKKQLEELTRTHEELRSSVTADASAKDDQYAKRIKELEEQVKELTSQCAATQERLEDEVARSARTVEAVSQRASNIKHNSSEYGNSPQKENPHASSTAATEQSAVLLGDSMSEALKRLDESLKGRLHAMHEQLISMNTVKDMLEVEVSTMTTSMEVVNKDFLHVQQELEAMKGAYSALQQESLGGESAQKLERANNLLVDMQAEVAAATRRTIELERLPPVVAELESKCRTLEAKVVVLENEQRVQSEEAESYKKMCESLKQKIRDLSAKSDSSEKDFLDSFEEVMQDEMYTMKQAFEAKLKAKADEAAAMSNRHALEISRIQASASPFSQQLLGRR